MSLGHRQNKMLPHSPLKTQQVILRGYHDLKGVAQMSESEFVLLKKYNVVPDNIIHFSALGEIFEHLISLGEFCHGQEE